MVRPKAAQVGQTQQLRSLASAPHRHRLQSTVQTNASHPDYSSNAAIGLNAAARQLDVIGGKKFASGRCLGARAPHNGLSLQFRAAGTINRSLTGPPGLLAACKQPANFAGYPIGGTFTECDP